MSGDIAFGVLAGACGAGALTILLTFDNDGGFLDWARVDSPYLLAGGEALTAETTTELYAVLKCFVEDAEAHGYSRDEYPLVQRGIEVLKRARREGAEVQP